MKLPGAEDGLVCTAAELFRLAAVWGRSEVVPVRSEEVLVRAVAALPSSAEDLVLVPVVLVRPAVDDVLPSAVPDRSGLFRRRPVLFTG